MAEIKNPEYFVRVMCPADNHQVIEICNKVGSCISAPENVTMMKIDPNCLYVAEEIVTGKILGVCGGIVLSPKLGYIAEYAVHPDYQRKGIGQALWKKAIEHVGDRNISLITMPNLVPVYRDKCGFKIIPDRKVNIYKGLPQLSNLNNDLVNCDIECITGHNLWEVIQYDEMVYGTNRAQILELTILEPGTVSLLARYIENSCIAGFAIFKTINNLIIPRPLYADNDNIAEALIYNCINKFVSYDGFRMEVWDLNHGGNMLANKIGLTLLYQPLVMFTKEDVSLCNFKNFYSQIHFYQF